MIEMISDAQALAIAVGLVTKGVEKGTLLSNRSLSERGALGNFILRGATEFYAEDECETLVNEITDISDDDDPFADALVEYVNHVGMRDYAPGWPSHGTLIGD